MAIEVDNPGGDKSKKPGNNAGASQPPAPEPAGNQNTAGNTPPPNNQSSAGSSNQSNNSTNNDSFNQGNRMNTISSRTNYGMSRAATSLAMRNILEAIDKIAEGENEQPVKFTYHSLDGEKEGLLISSLVVTAVVKNAGPNDRFVAYHTLLLAATAKGVDAVEQTVPNSQIKYERLVVAADAYDAALRGRVEEVVRQNNPGYQLIDADATVVPSNVDLKSEDAVRNIIANATTATSTLLASLVANDTWSITEEQAKKTFQLEVKSSWAHFMDLTGQPVRGDIVLEMSVLTGKNQNQNNGTGEFRYNDNQARQLITQMLGYIDLVSTPPAALSGGLQGFGNMTGMVNNPQDMKIYAPRLVITNIDAPEEPPELPILLQGLATAWSLQNNNNWQGALIQQYKNGAQHAENGVNIRDLSVIGLEAPQMMPLGFMQGEPPKQQRIPLNSAGAGDAMVAGVVQTYFHDDLLISMDIPECGASSWMSAVFAAAARGDQTAIQEIYDASNLLTRGLFTDIAKANNKGVMPVPFFNDNMFVNLGFYPSTTGPRDIRDGDYLAVANATLDSEAETLNDWSNLQANFELDPMFRLTETRRLQTSIFDSMTITGRAVRITANPAYLFSLASAIQQAGLVYDTKMGTTAAQSTARMVPQYMRQMATGLGNVQGFATAGMRRPGTQGNANNSFGRYSHNNNRSNSQPGGVGNF